MIKELNRKTIEKLLNEIFTLDKQENENRVERFANENDINRFWSLVPTNNLVSGKIVYFGHNLMIYWIIAKSCNLLNNVV